MNPLQQAAFRRKLYYFAVILGLFTLSMLWRGGMIPIPLGGSFGPARWLAAHTIREQAHRLELRELEEGDPEIAGSAIRLGLIGSRGLVVTALWQDAIEKQKRNDFHQFELRVRAVTKLQPHFISPWIFQSWNIAYNVSVEMHSMGDMYFYIARGIELLAEGERRNKRSPDMRFQIAFYYQNKFGVADQVQTLRCLYQLSCIPPNDRNPVNLEDPNDPDGVNRQAFLAFCQKHPHLVRRLRGEERHDLKAASETLRCHTPRDVIQFIKDNRNVPTRYKNGTDLAPAEQQFPVLPPKFNEGPDEAHPGAEYGHDDHDDFSGYLAARAWFAYSCVLVPPQPQFPEEEGGGPRPSGTPQPGPPGTTEPDQFDATQYRVPRLPMLILFLQGAPRAQSFQAEMEQKDGWFDDQGWVVDENVDVANAWFVERVVDGDGRALPPRKQAVVIGKGPEWSGDAWRKAADMWRRHGTEHALVMSLARLEALRAEVGDTDSLPPDLTSEQRADPAYLRRWRGMTALFFYRHNRSVTNFPYYLASAEAEAQKETVQARKTLWQADQARRVGNRQAAINLYLDGLNRWKQVLLKNHDFHRSERFDRTSEETFEYELEYLRLIAQDDPKVWAKAREEYDRAVRAVVPFLPPSAEPMEIPSAYRQDLYADVAEQFFSPFGGLVPANVGDDRAGTAWIGASTKSTVLIRQGIGRPQGPPGAGAGAAPAMGGP